MSLMFRLYPYIFGVSALIAITVVVWMRGYDACKNEQAQNSLKEEKTHVQIERSVIRLPDADLDKRLSRWMRD